MAARKEVVDVWKRRLEKGVLIAQIFSLVAIPIVLAAVGYWVQRTLQNQQIERDYVNLAVSMLKSNVKDDTPPELKAWAVRLLNKNSPVPLDQEEVAVLVRRGLGSVRDEAYLDSAVRLISNQLMLEQMGRTTRPEKPGIPIKSLEHLDKPGIPVSPR